MAVAGWARPSARQAASPLVPIARMRASRARTTPLRRRRSGSIHGEYSSHDAPSEVETGRRGGVVAPGRRRHLSRRRLSQQVTFRRGKQAAAARTRAKCGGFRSHAVVGTMAAERQHCAVIASLRQMRSHRPGVTRSPAKGRASARIVWCRRLRERRICSSSACVFYELGGIVVIHSKTLNLPDEHTRP